MFEICALEFIKIETFMQNKNTFEFETKNILFGYFWAVISRQYCPISN